MASGENFGGGYELCVEPWVRDLRLNFAGGSEHMQLEPIVS